MGNLTQEWIEQLGNLQHALTDLSMEELAGKVEGLSEKSRSGKLHIAFCGHFSAGKSTLINRLCGVSLLPSSPIPTSANIVHITSGETEEAILRFRDGSEKRVRLEEAADHAKNGEEVREVELRAPIPWLGDRGVLLDTPGVDSTDEAHRESTESALHLADVVVFVMDYNHVLSEMNMNFAKQLTEMGKPLILVVNQIDKHREAEVSFETFRQGVDDTFRSWNAVPAACFYTSMRVPNHPLNEAPLLSAWLEELVQAGTAYAAKGIASAAVEIANEAHRLLRERNEPLREQLFQRASLEEEGALERYEALRTELNRRKNVRKTLADKLRSEAEAIADNANITPAATRDLVYSFLESRQPGFRSGFLFASKKTEEEKKRRLEALCHDFKEHVTANILRHVRSAVKQAAFALELDERTADAASEAVDVEVTEEWLLSKVRAGVPVSGEYTLNYSREIAAEVRQAVKRSVQAAADRLADAAEERYEREMPQWNQQLSELKEKLKHRRELEALEAEEDGVKERLLSLIPALVEACETVLPFPEMKRLAAKVEHPAEGGESFEETEAAPVLDLSRIGNAEPAAGGTAAMRSDFRSRFVSAASILEEASREVSVLGRPLASASKMLLEKAKRLKEQTFTAALFGAFSAGKSSFANALLGSAALPVSPNPTTAAINTVVPPAEDHPHGSAVVRMKTRESVYADLRYALQALGVELSERDRDVPDLLARARKLPQRPDLLPPGASAHLAFVQAAMAGWAEAEPLLGTKVEADSERFRAFVAEEKKSAFVEGIELYYDSALARQGITLVDTPGADSINARHTGVTFNYLKNADAVFFVTYYNHAFSRADRQFLEQLGRVKDALEMDKMFFIVNAADLAADSKELQDVLEHVRSNLVSFGIRFPRLFAVSSLQALEAKQREDQTALAMSGLSTFEEAFDRFAGGELASLVYRSAQSELERTADVLAQLLAQARSGEEAKAKAKDRLAQKEAEVRKRLGEWNASSASKDVQNELHEQLYYIKQRFQFRFGEWLNASFNPAVLREDRGAIKDSLAWAWRDMEGYIQKELVNEVLAAALRLERFMNQAMAETVGRWNDMLARTVELYNPEPWEDVAIPSPEIDSVWDGEEPDLKLLMGCYKSSKQFFEGGGRDQLREQLSKRWQASISESLEKTADGLMQWVEHEMSRISKDAAGRIERCVEEAFAASRSAWEDEIRSEEVESALARIRSLAEAFRANSQGTE